MRGVRRGGRGRVLHGAGSRARFPLPARHARATAGAPGRQAAANAARAGDHVPFGPCPTVPAGEGIPGAWLGPGLEIEPAIFARASKLEAISLDMGHGYAASARNHAPQAMICIDPCHVVQVRHEALPVRVGCETPPPGCRGSPVKLRAV